MKINKTFLWALAQRTGPAVVNFVFFLVLAKLMGPAQFGLLALAQVWLGGFRVFVNAGLSGAVIQTKTVSDEQLSSVFFLNFGVALLLVLISCGSVWLLPTNPEMSDLPPVVSLMSLTLLVSGFSLVQEALAYREMRFRFLAQRDFHAAVVGGAVGVGLAFNGFGVWSLVAQALVTSLTSTILLWRGARWVPKWSQFSIAGVKPLLGFSLWLLAFQLFAYFVREIDKTIIGVLIGISALGLYTLAHKVILLPTVIFCDAMNSYLFPKLSSIQDDKDDVGRVYSASVALTMSIALPLIFALAMGVHLYGTYALGAEWKGVEEIAPYVAVIAACQSYVSPAGSALKALGRVSLLFRWAIFVFGLLLVGTLAGSYFGLKGIMTGLVAAGLVSTVAVNVLIRHVLGQKSMLKQLLSLYAFLGFGLALAAITVEIIAILHVESMVAGLAVTFFSALIYFLTVVLLLRKSIGHYLNIT